MKGAFIILLVTLFIGATLYLADVLWYRKRPTLPPPDAKTPEEPEGECCGRHAVCEKTSLTPLTDKIEYYDDEELDRFAGREAADFTPAEIEEFRDVLLTLRPEEVAGWARSIQLRNITLPTEIRDELLMIVGDLRQQS